MRKLAVLIIISALIFSGCSHTSGPDLLGIAEIIGIDRDDSGFTVSVQYFNTDTSGGVTAVDSTSSNAVCAEGKGRTIESALEALSYSTGKKIIFGSASVIVFGKDALSSLSGALGLASSHHSGNLRAFITAADGKASDIIRVKFREGNASVEKLEAMIRNAESLGLCRPVLMYEALEKLCEPTESLVIPMLSCTPGNSGLTEDGSVITINGGALCSPQGFTDRLSLTEVSGLHILGRGSGSGDECEITFELNGKESRVIVYGIRNEVVPALTENGLRLDFSGFADCKTVSSDLTEPYYVKETIEKICAKELEKRTGAVLAKTLGAHGADVTGLSYRIRSYSPQIWNAIEDDYSGFLRKAEINIEFTVKMERFGIIHGS